MARVNKELHRIKAKFHYAILVAERFEAGRRPAASWNFAYSEHELAGLRPASDLSATSFGSVLTQLGCGGIFSDSIITNFLLILTVK